MPSENRILVLAPRGRDAAVIEQVLSRREIECTVCPDLDRWVRNLSDGAAAAIVTEETLVGSETVSLFAWLDAQPSWSDFPFIVLAVRQPGHRSPGAVTLLQRLGNVMLLERPVNAETLTSAAISVLRSRRRQYEARRHLLDLEEAHARLRAREIELRDLNGSLEQRVIEALDGRKVLSDIFENSDAQLMVISLGYDVLAINRSCIESYAQLYGKRLGTGDNLLDLLADQPDALAAQRRNWERALAGEVFNDVRLFGSPEFGQRHLDVRFNTLLDRSGARIGAYHFAYDVTERVRDAERLRETEEQLRQSQKFEAIGQLTGGIAHDFNNLLMVIAGGLGVIDRPIDPAKRERFMQGMIQAVERGAGLTRQLLAFSRQQPLAAEPVDLVRHMQHTNELLDRSLRGDIHVETVLAPDLWPVMIDPGQLDLVLINLAVNARDAMIGGGTITISARNVADFRDGDLQGDFVCLSVRDHGTGIPPDVMKRVFEPFFTTKDIGKGSGLGLAQVYGFVRQSGGTVKITSDVGQGTTVSLYLPRSSISPPVGQPEITAPRPGQEIRILLIEDDESVADTVSSMLMELGYTVSCSNAPGTALAALGQDPTIGLVLTDVMMPGRMDGLELAREIRRIRPDLPVVLASGHADPVRAEAAAHGFRILSKPFELQRLAREIGEALGTTADTLDN